MTNINRTFKLAKFHTKNIFLGRILNPLWHDKVRRRKRVITVRENALMGYLNELYPEMADIKPQHMTIEPEPEHVFTIWFQGEDNAPTLIKSCFDSMRRHMSLPLVVLDEKSLFDWIELPDYIIDKWRSGKIKHTQFSDICRIELLYRHGGVWLDSTDFVTAPVPQWIMDQDLFLYMVGQRNISGAYAYIQSCFIRGMKGNLLLGMWREAVHMFWKKESHKLDYFIHHLLLKHLLDVNPQASALFAQMPKVDQDPTHAVWWSHFDDGFSPKHFEEITSGACFQKTTHKDTRIASAKEGTVGHYMIYGS